MAFSVIIIRVTLRAAITGARVIFVIPFRTLVTFTVIIMGVSGRAAVTGARAVFVIPFRTLVAFTVIVIWVSRLAAMSFTRGISGITGTARTGTCPAVPGIAVCHTIKTPAGEHKKNNYTKHGA
jgi:hypothetical protein